MCNTLWILSLSTISSITSHEWQELALKGSTIILYLYFATFYSIDLPSDRVAHLNRLKESISDINEQESNPQLKTAWHFALLLP